MKWQTAAQAIHYHLMHKKRLAQAEERCGRYLADANAAEERGAKKTADRLYAKSGYWRDRMNKLSGDA